MDRRRRRKDSAGKTVVLLAAAAVVMVAAVLVVMTVFQKISSDYKKLETDLKEETTAAETVLEIEREEKDGWNELADGWKYRLADGTYAKEQWLDVDGFLYYFDENEMMRTGTWEQDGQIFTNHETKGYLKDIQVDLDYVPEETGEDLDSLVRTNAFWCYLDDSSEGIFKTILYRKTVEQKVLPLGSADAPERTTRYSMRTSGDYVYYLPKVKDSELGKLTAEEKELCNVLTRMIPGQKTKEVIAENVGGYLILDGTIYYSQNGKIYHTKSGTETAVGGNAYTVEVDGYNCYLLDGSGARVTGRADSAVAVGDRAYEIDVTGKIEKVSRRQMVLDGTTYYLGKSDGLYTVMAKSNGVEKALLDEPYGVQSYCLVDQFIYYSAYVEKKTNGPWNSQIFRTDLSGGQRTALGTSFAGTIRRMYYFEAEGKIYGEYHPEIWKSGYGAAVVIEKGGAVSRIKDSDMRNESTTGNDMLELVAVQDGKLICFWSDYQWSANSGFTNLLWRKAVTLDTSRCEAVEAAREVEEETTEAAKQTTAAPETDAIVKPIGGGASEQRPDGGSSGSGQSAKPGASGNGQSSGAPGSGSSSGQTVITPPPVNTAPPIPPNEGQPNQTQAPTKAPAATTAPNDVKIIPLS